MPDFSADKAHVMLLRHLTLPSLSVSLLEQPLYLIIDNIDPQKHTHAAHKVNNVHPQTVYSQASKALVCMAQGFQIQPSPNMAKLLAHQFKSFARIGSDSTAVMICLDVPAWPGKCCKPMIARLQAVILLPLPLLLMDADAGGLAATRAGPGDAAV